MKYHKHIYFNWFTIMGGIASALMYIQHTQHTCLADKRFHDMAQAATGN